MRPQSELPQSELRACNELPRTLRSLSPRLRFLRWLGDRFGPLRVTRAALVVYALGLFLPCITRSLWVLIPAMPLVGFGGTVVMTLSYALVALAGPAQSPGASAGWYEQSRGVGVIAGPIVTGAAIDVMRPLFASTQGYAAMWLVQALALLVSLPLVPKPAVRLP